MNLVEPLTASEISNWGFIAFLAGFFIFAYQTGPRRKMLLQMLQGALREKERESIFNESTGNETIDKLLFGLQTMLVSSLAVFAISIHEQTETLLTLSAMFSRIGLIFCTLLGFTFFRFIAGWLVGIVFFSTDDLRRWNNFFTSVICLSGTALFIPSTIIFFIKPLYGFGLFLIIIYLIFVVILTVFRLYSIFFSKKGAIFYFILYLCTLEAVPLYLLYRLAVSIAK
jgi:hypothetical protein